MVTGAPSSPLAVVLAVASVMGCVVTTEGIVVIIVVSVVVAGRSSLPPSEEVVVVLLHSEASRPSLVQFGVWEGP